MKKIRLPKFDSRFHKPKPEGVTRRTYWADGGQIFGMTELADGTKLVSGAPINRIDLDLSPDEEITSCTEYGQLSARPEIMI